MTETAERKFGLSSFILHILAMAFMLLDHIHWTLLPDVMWLTCIGRLAFPIFAFMIAEGFFHTKSRKKYALRLLVFAVITELPFNLVAGGTLFYVYHQNVLWTFLISVGLMYVYEKIKGEKHAFVRGIAYFLATLVFALAAAFLMTDYNAVGVASVALFYFTRTAEVKSSAKKAAFTAIQLLGMCFLNVTVTGTPDYSVSLFGTYIGIQSFAVLALPFIWLYNGKQGYYNRAVKLGYYLFYPAHCLILGLLALL